MCDKLLFGGISVAAAASGGGGGGGGYLLTALHCRV
jgi:hypothetical protein